MEETILDSEISNEIKKNWNWREKILVFCQIGFIFILLLLYYYVFRDNNLIGDSLYSFFPNKVTGIVYCFIGLGALPEFIYILKHPIKESKVKSNYLRSTPLIQLLIIQLIEGYFS